MTPRDNNVCLIYSSGIHPDKVLAVCNAHSSIRTSVLAAANSPGGLVSPQQVLPFPCVGTFTSPGTGME